MPGAAAFFLLCTMNVAGYRFGASDQALYLPAVLRHLDPLLFPRDAPLIDTQARLMFNDEIVALIARLTGASLPVLFLVLYSLTLVLLLAAVLRLGSHVVERAAAPSPLPPRSRSAMRSRRQAPTRSKDIFILDRSRSRSECSRSQCSSSGATPARWLS